MGESVKHLISRRLYLLSYGVVAAYGLADTIDKGRRAYAAHSPAAAPAGVGPAAALAAGARSLAGACADRAACLSQQAALAAAHYPHYLAGSPAEARRSAAAPVAAAVLDSAFFQATASLAIPAVLINR